MPNALTRKQAEEFAERLDVSLDVGICHACLSFVSMALDHGDEREIAHQLSCMTPDLWEEGLSAPAVDAAWRAYTAEAPHAAEALADLRARGGRSVVARAIVRRLAAELSDHARKENEQLRRVRQQNGGARPNFN